MEESAKQQVFEQYKQRIADEILSLKYEKGINITHIVEYGTEKLIELGRLLQRFSVQAIFQLK